ncbi:MAG: flavodoxin domain-containing protein [Anaerolineaceae bacterium]|nr:flavodoxin domain-containing protein [Anaerolineaceae bacterium]
MVENRSGQRILVAYASHFGTTAGVAQAIGETLRQKGNTVETKWVTDVQNLDGYDAVVIGSPIRYDHWMAEAKEFVTVHQNELSQRPVAYFFTCLTLARRTERTEQQAMAYADKLYVLTPQVQPVSIGRFAGVLDYSKMSVVLRLLAKVFSAIVRIPEGDYREWDAIRLWSENTHLTLSA